MVIIAVSYASANLTSLFQGHASAATFTSQQRRRVEERSKTISNRSLVFVYTL